MSGGDGTRGAETDRQRTPAVSPPASDETDDEGSGQWRSERLSPEERTGMATQRGLEFIAVSAEMRQVVRDLRMQLGVSRSTLEQRAKVGTDYLKHLEGGRHPSVEATRLRRVVGVLHQAAAREKVSAQLNARLVRVVKAVTPASKPSEKRAASGGKQ